MYKLYTMYDRGLKFITDRDGVVLYQNTTHTKHTKHNTWIKRGIPTRIDEFSSPQYVRDMDEGDLLVELL